MHAGQNLAQAAIDARWLLQRGYPRQKVLDLTGDRHALDREAREMIARGVFNPEEARKRRQKLHGLGQLAGARTAVDGHNVIITLETALRGDLLLLADDGAVRDIARLGRNHRPGSLTLRAARLAVEALQRAGVAGAEFFMHRPLPKSGWLAGEIRGMLREAGLAGDALTVDSPRACLDGWPGPVCSADSAVIEKARTPVDLAGEIIRAMMPAPTVKSL